MTIERRLKYIKFVWDEDDQRLMITTYPKEGEDALLRVDDEEVTGFISINKTYIFSVMRFMIRISQRMWGRLVIRKKVLDK